MAQQWLKKLQFPQACHQCGQVANAPSPCPLRSSVKSFNPPQHAETQEFTEEENHNSACCHHPGHFDSSILPWPKHFVAKGNDMVLLTDWGCCGKDVRSQADCPCNAQGQHAPGRGAVAGVVMRASTIERPVVIGADSTRYVVGQTTTRCCYKKLLTVQGCRTDCHRGSLTLANQHVELTPAEAEFICKHKAAYQLRKAHEPRTCTRCKVQYPPNQRGGCAVHSGAMDFVVKNEGTPNERCIFDHYECCSKTVHDSPGCLSNGRHASSATDTQPFPVADQMLEQACTRCCHKTLQDVPGCRPADHDSPQPDMQFAQEEATHVFYVQRFMTSIARYVRNAKSVVPSDQSTCSAAARATEAKLKSQGLTLDADPGKHVKCLICWEEFAWGGVTDGSTGARPVSAQQATCCSGGTHVYCQECLQGHVQSKVEALVTSIDCPQACDCSSRAWTPKEISCMVDREVFATFDKLLLETAAEAAGNVVSCPACGEYSEFQPDPADTDGFPHPPIQLFCCAKCLQVSCLKCKAAVGVDRRMQHECALSVPAARRKLEEVLTQAGMLTCPRCHTGIVKDGGCNHMTCTKCRTHLCLLCCEVLAEAGEHRDVYRHFNTAGSQCWLFDNASSGQTEDAAIQRRQIMAANKYLATLDPAMALQVIDCRLLRDFPADSIMVSAGQG